MKLLCEALFLSCVLFAVAYSSGLWLLALPYFAAIVWLYRVRRRGRRPLYRKSVAYGAIVPFSLWWAVSPSQGVVSPWLLIIPAWYFMFLALWQWRGIGRGGFMVFVRWCGIFVLLLSLREPDKVQLALTACAFLFMLLGAKPPRRNLRFACGVALSLAVAALMLLGFQKAYEWRRNAHSSGEWEARYRNERTMMGFSPVAALGSFRVNYLSDKNSQIVLRLWTDKPPTYLRAVAYGDYSGGIWNLPKRGKWLVPELYLADYAAVTELDSIRDEVWVQASLNTFEFVFAPPGAGVACKEADSVMRIAGGTYRAPEQNKGDWYYLPNAVPDTGDLDLFLSTPHRLEALFDSALSELGLDSATSPSEAAQTLKAYFASNFKYTLEVPWRKGKEDPLETFWETRSGFCEYFASFATLALRSLGIPARYVVGFSMPERASGYAVFRRNRSHAWVEYYDSTWKTFDPTPNVIVGSFTESAGDRFFEALKARAIYIMHVLRDGTWRKSLDSLSSLSERLLASTAFYAALALIALLALALYLLQRLKKLRSRYSSNSRIRDLQKLLQKSERTLRKFGQVRASGETVGAFLRRSRAAKVEPAEGRKARKIKAAQSGLALYEERRWRRES